MARSLLAFGAFFSIRAMDAGVPLVLETGHGLALQRQTTSLSAPVDRLDAALRFEIEWASSERAGGVDLADALTLSLRNATRTYVATLLTVDALGATLLPHTPGGDLLPTSDLLTALEPLPPTDDYPFRLRVQGLLRLPELFRSQTLVLSLSLFDNLDSSGSRGMLVNSHFALRFDLPIELESSDAAVGPFARQIDARLDRAALTFTVPKVTSQRFFRLESRTSSRIRNLRRVGEEWVLDYDAEMGTPTLFLEGSEDRQTYLRVTNATIDLEAGKAIVPLFKAPAFFRFSGSHPVRIVGDEVSGETRILRFEVFPPVPTLFSSALPEGPFALTPGASVDPFSRRISLPVAALSRFFRIRSEIPLRVREIRDEGSQVIIRYEEP